MSGLIVFPFAQRPVGRDARAKVPVRPLAPRISPAAVRIPDPRHVQFELPFPAGSPRIFVHEGARQLLERRLWRALGKPVQLSLTDNCRNVLSLAEKAGVMQVRLHHMFLDAPVRVKAALVKFLATRDREASVVVGSYIEANSYRIRALRPFLRPLETAGAHHDLLQLFGKVNSKYFGGTVDALITWGRDGRRRDGTRSSLKLGSYSAIERLIRVHPVLDRPWVPRYFVSYVIYHEMLHHVIPAVTVKGRRSLHPPHFLEREAMFRDFDRALAWERTHLHRLLRCRAE